MPYPLADAGYAVMIEGKPTFYGMLVKYYDDIGKKYGLSAKTNETYAKECERYIIPKLDRRSLDEYIAEDYDRILQEIALTEERCSRSTLLRYRRHIKRVVEMAVECEGMRDPLWGVEFMPPTTPGHIEQKEKMTLPKSLTVQQQCQIGDAIYSDADKSGDKMGLMLAYEAGLRPKEVAGVSFGDFQMYSGYAIVALHTSTIGQGHERHGRLKTRNGYRMVVFGEKASRIILSRKERIETALKIGKINVQYGAMSAISVAPMVARIDNPMVPYSSIQISNSYRALLRDVGYDNRDYQAAVRIVGSEDFTEAERKANPEELGFAKVKDPTVYINRRQFCTDMHIVGCTPEERQYAMGHRIENTSVDRRTFRNEDMLKILADKLNRRPSVNRKVLSPQCYTVSQGEYVNRDFNNEHIKLPVKKGKIRIWVSSHESICFAQLTITPPEGVNIGCTYYDSEDRSEQRQTVNVLNDYYDAFKEAYNTFEQQKNDLLETKTIHK